MKTYMEFIVESINTDKARSKGFDTNTIWYHGTPFDFSKFDIERGSNENMFGTGLYLTTKREDAETYKYARKDNPIDVLGTFDDATEAEKFAKENAGRVVVDNNATSPYTVVSAAEGNVFEILIRGKYATPETKFPINKLLAFAKASPNFQQKVQDFFGDSSEDFDTFMKNTAAEPGIDSVLGLQNIFYKNTGDFGSFVKAAKQFLDIDGFIIPSGNAKHAVVFDPKNARRVDAKFDDLESNDLMG